MSQLMSKPLLIEPHYLPSISWFNAVSRHTEIWLDVSSHYEKGSYRNRTLILAANGVQRLSVPLEHGRGQKIRSKDLRISYAENWQKNHWQAICSSYKRSPFFDYFADMLEPFYARQYPFMIDLQTGLISSLSRMMRLPLDIRLTEQYIEPHDPQVVDLRNMVHPQHTNPFELHWLPYTQVFSDRSTFIPDLSIIDVIFNRGKFNLTDLYL